MLFASWFNRSGKMSLTPGTTLGSFEISGLLGVGGMGEVYRAKDNKLGREVAIVNVMIDPKASRKRQKFQWMTR